MAQMRFKEALSNQGRIAAHEAPLKKFRRIGKVSDTEKIPPPETEKLLSQGLLFDEEIQLDWHKSSEEPVKRDRLHLGHQNWDSKKQ